MPLEGLIGGLLIGIAAALMLLCLGRIAGISGLAARAAGIAASGPPVRIAIAFIVGLPLGALIYRAFFGHVAASFPPSLGLLGIAGLLVGFGTRLGSGCTSGHGICGLSRFSRRSIAATVIFMATGVAAVGLLRTIGG